MKHLVQATPGATSGAISPTQVSPPSTAWTDDGNTPSAPSSRSVLLQAPAAQPSLQHSWLEYSVAMVLRRATPVVVGTKVLHPEDVHAKVRPCLSRFAGLVDPLCTDPRHHFADCRDAVPWRHENGLPALRTDSSGC